MQTNIRTTTIDNDIKRVSHSRTIEHEMVNIISREIPADPIEITNPRVEIDLSAGGNVLDIMTTPPSMIGVKFDADDTYTICSGLFQGHHWYNNVKLINRGALIGMRKVWNIEGITVGESTHTKISLDIPWGKVPYLEGDIKGGYFNVNDQYICISLGNYSEQKVYIYNCGIYDANGDKYIYDPNDDDMIPSDDYYGVYQRCKGEIVADALDRSINAMFNIRVVDVYYDNDRFIIKAVHPLISSIAISPDPYSIAAELGLYGKNTHQLMYQDIDGKVVYLGEELASSEATLTPEGDIILPVEYSQAMDYAVVYILDPAIPATVNILSA